MNKEEAFSELERVCEIYTEEVMGYASNLSVSRYKGKMSNDEEWWLLVRHTPEDSGTYVLGLPFEQVINRMKLFWNSIPMLEKLVDSYDLKKARDYDGEYIDILRAYAASDFLFTHAETIVGICYG